MVRLILIRWWWARRREAMAIWCAGRLPRWLVYRAFIRAGVETIHDDEVVPEVRYVDLLQRLG